MGGAAVRRQITLLATLASILAVTLFAVPLAVVVARYLLSDERVEVQRSAATAAAAVSGDLSRALPSSLPGREAGKQISVYDEHGTRIRGAGPAHAGTLVARALTGVAGTGSVDGRIAAANPVSDGDSVTGAVLATTTHAQVNQRIALAWTVMLGLALLAIAATALLARRYSGRLASPVEQLARAAHQIGAGDFTARTTKTGIGELDTLSTAMNLSAQRLDTMMRRERAFSADASHQLRTPLTGMRLELEAALDDATSDPRVAIAGALCTADRLEQTITALLALARDTPSPTATPAVELLDDLQRRWNGPLAQLNRPLRVVALPGFPPLAMTSPIATAQILDVLVDNARQHGRGAVTVTLRDASPAIAIDVADEGPPVLVDPKIMFGRSADADGHGIGLALARALAEAEGGRLIFSRSHPPTFTLLLRAMDTVESATYVHRDADQSSS